MGSQLKPKDKARLSSVLSKLPPEIEYLREAILKIAEEDQDLLGSGEADIDPIFQAFKAAATDSYDVVASDHADILRKWLKKMSNHNEKWAAPLWFVVGVLRGFDFFDFDLDRLPPRPIPNGLEKIDIDIPAGMKTKLYVRGVELRERGVQIIIGESDAAFFQEKLKAFLSGPTDFQIGPHLCNELDPNFRIGRASGIKVISRDIASGLPVMVTYMLFIHDVNLEIGVFSRKKSGSDIEKYEHLFASIRLKNSQ